MEYNITGYRPNDLVRLDIKINGELAEPLANIVHREAAYRTGRSLVKRLKELIPRQQFKIPIQAAIGGRIVAAESLSGLTFAASLACCCNKASDVIQGCMLLNLSLGICQKSMMQGYL